MASDEDNSVSSTDAGLLPNPGNVRRDSYGWRSLLAGGLMFRLVVDGVHTLTGSDPSRVITMTAERTGAFRGV